MRPQEMFASEKKELKDLQGKQTNQGINQLT